MRTFPAPALIALILLASGPLAMAQAPAKKMVSSEADLPRHSYPVDQPASVLVQADDATFNAVLAKARANIDDELSNYDIKDRATLRDLLDQRVDQLELSGDLKGALAALDAYRAAQDKPVSKLTAGLGDRAILTASLDTNSTSGPAFEEAYTAAYAGEINSLPWDGVQDWAKAVYASARLASPALRLAYLMTEVDPAVAKGHSLNDEEMATVIYTRSSLKLRLPVASLQAKVLGAYIAAHNTKKPDIWAAREVTLSLDQVKAPVLVAIWDSGIDVSLFPGQTFDDPNPTPSGPHGLAFTDVGEVSTSWLYPLTAEQQARYPEVRDDIVGRLDIEEGKESPQAAQLEKKLKTESAQQLHELAEIQNVIGHYVHGTHCAGIAVRGNPGARLVVARFNDELPYLPFAPTEAWATKMGAAFQQMADYFRTRHVRVVNMSWSDYREEFESWLSKTGGGADPVARKMKADKIFLIWKAAIANAIKSAPDTLFVTAAGNNDNNNGFVEAVPSSLKLPNIFSVGAVNQAGDETSFTSYGDSVLVDADGYDVESYVPGGARIKLSGTSMASPNVVNLAAKLFALDPSLTPVQVIDLIRKGATASADGRLHLIDEKRSVALLAAVK